MIAENLADLPVIAILRGIKPDEVSAVATTLYDGGVRCIEVPLNSPSPLDSITTLVNLMPADCLVGAGTVLTADDVQAVFDAGGRLIVTPNTSSIVISKAVALDMQIAPGVATPTDAFNAVDSGARYLKLFPASTYGPNHIRALQAVLPKDVQFLAVGGIGPDSFEEWLEAGAIGFGIGSELYRAGDSAETVKAKLAAIVHALRN